MQNVVIYCSQPASGQMTTFFRSVCHVEVRPLAQLPAPDPLRCQRLRLEREELVEAIAGIQHDLECFEYGEYVTHAGRENGLRAELDARLTRLRAVEAILGREEGGQPHA